jgi:hypothetical protein
MGCEFPVMARLWSRVTPSIAGDVEHGLMNAGALELVA